MEPEARGEWLYQRSRLVWLMFCRVVVVTFLLGGMALLQLRQQGSPFSGSVLGLYLLIGFAYFLTFIYAILINQLARLDALAYLQMGGDIFFVTLLIYVTGVNDSPFTMGYLLVIVAASILLYRKGAFLIAAGGVLAYTLVHLASYYDWLRPPVWLAPRASAYTLGEISSSLLVNISAFFMVAALSSYLAEQLRRASQLLKEKEIDYQELDALNKIIVHSMTAGLLTTDQKGRVTSLNKAGVELLGKKLRDLYQLPIFELFPEIEEFCHRDKDGNISFSKKESGLKIKGKEGELRYFTFHVTPLTNSQAQSLGWIINFGDITHYRELEERARIEEKLKVRREAALPALELGGLIGKSGKMKEVYQFIHQVAASDANILVQGESGTGKELVARAIHYQSPRRDSPFFPVNLGGIPETLMESELFGHKRGSFTGAISDKPGLFELGRGGTLFLDEIGELSLATQVKLLRVIQEKSFRAVGGTKDYGLDVRFITATNKDLWAEVKKGSFREDLYYRFNVIQVNLPPLRERGDDILLLAQHFLEKHSRAQKKALKGISPSAMKLLMEYPFPGNVRELENIIERGVTLELGQVLSVEGLPSIVSATPARSPLGLSLEMPEAGLDLDGLIGYLEKDLLLKALERAGGVKSKAAQLLNISFRSFRYRLAKYGLAEGEGESEDF